MNRPHVAVLMGGTSAEHDVSVMSGTKAAENLDRGKYRVSEILIDHAGNWRFPDGSRYPLFEAVSGLKSLEIDCAFLALHGPFGEDGRIQGLLDLMDIPYTGSGCAASALAMDKTRCKAVVSLDGVRVAGHVAAGRRDWEADPAELVSRISEAVGYPAVVKNPYQGSSLGMAIAHDAEELRSAIELVLGFGDDILAEAFVAGTEVTCSVMDLDPGARPTALPVTEIVPVTSPYFDYEAKYTPGGTDEITPARIPEAVAKQVQTIAVHVHELVGCRHFSRSDMILDGQGPVWIEVNTIPGLTDTSLYPQAAAAVGIGYSELMDRFVEAALATRNRK